MNKKEVMAEKIRKLLNLAENNDNENQALAALAKARELMREYGISEDEVNDSGEKVDKMLVEMFGSDYLSQIDTWNNILVRATGDLFDCTAFVQRSGKSNKYRVRVFFVGTSADVALAREVWPFFVQYVRKKATENFGPGWNPKHRTFAEMFAIRLLERVESLLEQERLSKDPQIQQYGLVLAEKQNQITRYLEQNGIKLGAGGGKHIRGEFDANAARKGTEAADSVNLNFRKQVTGSASDVKRIEG